MVDEIYLKMLYSVLLAASVFLATIEAVEHGSNDLLKRANERISQEYFMTDPFWTNTMIPVAVCLAVVLLIVSIFAVSLIAIKALNEPEPVFSTFAPPGFDALWERNVQAELGMNNSRRKSLETIVEEEVEDTVNYGSKKKHIPVKLPEIMIKPIKNTIQHPQNIPSDPPKPTLATNSKNGLDTV